MPFINTSGILRVRRTAGGLRVEVNSMMIVSCDSVITLSGTPMGPELGHRFEWTQISGTPVTWLENTDQLIVMFEQTAVRDDKVFRLTVDGGTPFARTYDILVTAIPTDFVYTEQHSVQFGGVSLLTDNPSLQPAIAPALRPAGVQVLDDEWGMLVANTPTYAMQIVDGVYGIGLWIRSGTGFVEDRVHPVSKTTVQVINEVPSNVSLKLVTSRTDYGITTTEESNVVSRIFPIPNLHELSISDGEVVAMSGASKHKASATILQLFQPSLITVDEPTELVSGGVRVSSTASVLEVITRELIQLPEVPEDVAYGGHQTATIGGIATAGILEIRNLDFSSLG